MGKPNVFTVGQINGYIKRMLEEDYLLGDLWIKGEISNFKAHPSGHFYFTLKDSVAAISCVMFRREAEVLPFVPENGQAMVLWGYISLYEKTGQYQLYVRDMEPVGVGTLALKFLALKEKLGTEGLFDEEFKRDILPFPKTIAIITSPKGAAIHDMITILKRRNPSVDIVVVPVLVQGDRAPDHIVAALRLVNQWGKADTIILGRGGGSIEDLWAFNEEKVARAIFASEIPVISAVGHETDFTIADFVADLRASTPSAAAELSTEVFADKLGFCHMLLDRLRDTMERNMNRKREQLSYIQNRPVLKRPLEKIQNTEIYLQELKRRMIQEQHRVTKNKANQYQGLFFRLQGSSPLSLMKRGYAYVEDSTGKGISSVLQVALGDEFTIRLSDGILKGQVTERLVAENGEKEIEL